MSRRRDEDDIRRNKAIHGIFEAHEAAQKAINQYDYQRQWVAWEGKNPRDDPNVAKKHIQMHTTTLNLWRRIRPIAREDFVEYWNESLLYKEPPHAQNTEEAERYIIGLKSLAGFQGSTDRYYQTESSRHGRTKQLEREDPVLLPPLACRRTVETIGDMMREAGWIKPSEGKNTLYEMGEIEPADEVLADDEEESIEV